MAIAIKCEKRNLFGKNASRRLRREGKIPGIFYGTGTETVPLTLDKQDVIDILRSESGENTIFKVIFESETRDTMLKMMQIDPVSDELLHADLIQVAMDKEIRVLVSFSLVGDAIGVKTEGGFIDFVTREVEVECLPRNIPESIEVDISELHMNQSLKIEEIPPPEGIRFLSDPTSIIVLVSAPTKEEEIEVEEIEEEAVEGEEVESAEAEKQEEDREEKKE
jgi:large subunit ribosomal protein L25